MKFITLNNGLEMPIIGLGTWPLNKLKLVKAVYFALKSGYSSFDTSSAYGNEKWLGFSLKLFKIFGLTKNTFITTKLSNPDQRKGNVRQALKNSMRKLGVNQVDLYLMHWPNPETYLDSWKQMEELYNEGFVKAIGVCNFHEHHLDKLLEIAQVIPVINQVELHPLLTQDKLKSYCDKRGIKLQAYSPVARMDPVLVENEVLVKISNKYNKTVPQVILRWNVQNDIASVPKSGNKIRLAENINIFNFELTLEEMKIIDELNQNYRVRYNPDTVDYSRV